MLTVDKNLLYWHQDENRILQLNLLDAKMNLPFADVDSFTDQQVTCVVASQDHGKTYCVGCLDGSVHVLSAVDLRPVAHIPFGASAKEALDN